MRAKDLLVQKISRVETIFHKYRLRLVRDETLSRFLSCYLEAVAASEAVAQETGLAAFCARCGREGLGTCCGEDMEFHCEDVLLLANLVLGVEIPSNRYRPEGCYFLGEEGCLLRVRPLICRNFLCPELVSFLGEEKVKAIQETLGPEAEALFRLCEYLRRLCPEI